MGSVQGYVESLTLADQNFDPISHLVVFYQLHDVVFVIFRYCTELQLGFRLREPFSNNLYSFLEFARLK